MERVALLLAVLVLVAGTGCSGPESDAEPIRTNASRATVAPDALSATGYELAGERRQWLNTTISARIQGDVTLQTTRVVNASVAVAEYRRGTDGPPAVLGLYSVPGVQPFESANLTKNPAESLDAAALAVRAQSTFVDVRDVEKRGERTVAMLGTQTTLARYTATAAAGGSGVEVDISVATVRHDGDYVTAVLVGPPGATDLSRTDRLLAGVRH